MKIKISEDKKIWLYPILFIAFSLAIYWPSLFGEPFWDDWVFIFKAYRQQMHAVSPLIFFPGGSESKSWPVFYSLLWLMVKFFKDQYLLYHLTNIVFHGLNGFLIWKILKKIHVHNAMLWSLIFLAHPLHLFTVAWIIQLKTTFSITFFLCSILFLIRFFQREKSKYYFLSIACFVLSLLTKSTTVGFAVPILFSYPLFKKQMSFKKFSMLFIVPILLLSLAATLRTAMSYNIKDAIGVKKAPLQIPMGGLEKLKRVDVSNVSDATDKILLTTKLLGRYSAFIFFPIGGDHIFQEPTTVDLTSLEFLIIFAILLGIYYLCRYLYFRHLHFEFLGLIFYLATIVPFCGFIFLPVFSTTNFNPYWLSIPVLGLLPLGSHFFRNKIILSIVIVLCAGLTHWQSYQFINTEDLFLDSIKLSPEQKIYQASLIEHYVNTHRCQKAVALYIEYSKTADVRMFNLKAKVERCEEINKDQK